jgi:hypothetical protein
MALSDNTLAPPSKTQVSLRAILWSGGRHFTGKFAKGYQHGVSGQPKQPSCQGNVHYEKGYEHGANPKKPRKRVGPAPRLRRLNSITTERAEVRPDEEKEVNTVKLNSRYYFTAERSCF